MSILIFSILVALFFLMCGTWTYINSCVFVIKKFVNDEIVIDKVPMQQFFHFD